jgi:bifunctional DNA-binding transcriptional regulator/antitoxin component of YhaV-PrlF toxin-antitoxin module
MKGVSTTKMSTKGQVVIPEAIRIQWDLPRGLVFIVRWEKGKVTLEPIRQ